MKTSCALLVVGLIAAAVPAVAADQPVFWIVNGTRATMVAVQVRPTGSREWKALVQREPLGFNGRVQGPALAGKCQLFDIQVLFDDGRRVIKARQNLCAPGPYKITDY